MLSRCSRGPRALVIDANFILKSRPAAPTLLIRVVIASRRISDYNGGDSHPRAESVPPFLPAKIRRVLVALLSN